MDSSTPLQEHQSHAEASRASNDNDSIILWLELATHATCKADYEANRDSFLKAREKALPALDVLGINSQLSTTAPSQPRTAKQLPIYHTVRFLGCGSFGTIYKVRDVSTGEDYAAKKFHPGSDFQREVSIASRNSHVSTPGFDQLPFVQ